MGFILSSGRLRLTERKIKQIEVSFEPERRSNQHAKFYNVTASELLH